MKRFRTSHTVLETQENPLFSGFFYARSFHGGPPHPFESRPFWGYGGAIPPSSLPGYPQVPPVAEIKLRKAKPLDKPYKIAIGNGRYLLINPIGSKLWRWKYRVDGKEKLLALGSGRCAMGVCKESGSTRRSQLPWHRKVSR
jgi:hypothetical protein